VEERHRFALGVATVVAVLLLLPFLPSLVKIFAISPGASLVQEGDNLQLFNISRTVFYHDGYWIISRSLADGSLCYFYSPDGVSWSGPRLIEPFWRYHDGRGAAVWKEPYPSPYVHIVYYGVDEVLGEYRGIVSGPRTLYYRRGEVRPGGVIEWGERVAVVRGIQLEFHGWEKGICVSENNVWILYRTWEDENGWVAYLKCLNTGDILRLGNEVRVSESAADKQMAPLPGGKVAIYGDGNDGSHKVLTVSTSGVEQTEEVLTLGADTWNLNIVRSGDRLYVAFPWHDDSGEHVSVYARLPSGWTEVYRSAGESPYYVTPVSLTATPTGGLVLFYMRAMSSTITGIYTKGVMVKSADGINWGAEEEILHPDSDEVGFLLGDSSYCADAGKVPTLSFSLTTDYKFRLWFWKTEVPVPSPPPSPPMYLENMYLGAGPKVSAFGYYFTSENGCVLLVRAVCENGDPLPAGTRVRMDSEYLSQTEYDVWYKIYPAGTPPPSTVSVTFEIPGYINISQAVAVSTGGALGDLQVFTVDEKGNPVPALVEVRMNGALVGSQQSTGVATFRGLSAGKATVSGVSTGLLSPPPIEVDVAPNRMSTATLVFRRIYDPSVTGKVSVTNTGSYTLVITFDGKDTYTVSPGETVYLEMPAGDHYAVYTGTEPLLYDPQVITFTLEQGEEELQYLQVSPARDENWLREWMENARMGVGVGDLAVTVVDKASGTPIPGATVYLDVGLQQTTNNSGLCYFKGVPTGDRKVKACAQGYFPTTATAKVSEGAATSVQVFLRGFLYEAKPSPPTGRYLILGFLAILLPGVVMWLYRRR